MLRLIIAAPFLLVVVLFALSNPQLVHLTFWPTDYTLDAPLSLTVLVGMGVALLLGAFMLWFGVVGAKARARRAERQVKMLEAQVAELRGRVAAATTYQRPMPPGVSPQRELTVVR
jgi:putative membrane protein